MIIIIKEEGINTHLNGVIGTIVKEQQTNKQFKHGLVAQLRTGVERNSIVVDDRMV